MPDEEKSENRPKYPLFIGKYHITYEKALTNVGKFQEKSMICGKIRGNSNAGNVWRRYVSMTVFLYKLFEMFKIASSFDVVKVTRK